MATAIDTSCSICGDCYRDPRFLPCYHTFCARCIERYAEESKNARNEYACPMCRTKHVWSENGVAGLQVNFYIRSRPVRVYLAAAGRCVNCLHSEMICDTCDRLICHECLDNGLHQCKHKTRRRQKKYKLQDECQRCGEQSNSPGSSSAKESGYESTASGASAKSPETRRKYLNLLKRVEQQKKKAYELMNTTSTLITRVKQKEQDVIQSIDDRCELIITAARTAKDTASKSVKTMFSEAENQMNTSLSTQEKCMRELWEVKEQLNSTKKSEGTFRDLETKVEKYEQDLMSSDLKGLEIPVLRSGVLPDVMLELLNKFMGDCHTVDFQISAENDFSVLGKFQCSSKANGLVDIFSLIHSDDDRPEIRVCYEVCSTGEKFQERFDESGQLINKDEVTEKQYHKIYAPGKAMYPAQEDGVKSTFSKSNTSVTIFRLNSRSNGMSELRRVSIHSEPFEVEGQTEMTMNVGLHHSLDVNESAELIVVLEEPVGSDMCGKVLLFKHLCRNSIDTYNPPLTHFRPSDICFYKMHGREVLLVADEANDAIHVVGVTPKGLKFERFLSVDDDFILQPTTLNVDSKGRLWVGCRNGSVMCVAPKKAKK